MTLKGKSRLPDSQPTATDGVSSDEWFVRYLLNAVLLVVLALAAVGVALYLDASGYLRDWGKEQGAGFVVCMLLCPMLGMLALALAIYAGARLFSRPRTFGHAFVRLALLVAHLSIVLVCADAISSTTTAVVASLGQSSSGTDPTQVLRPFADRDLSGSQDDGRDGAPDAPPFWPPPGFGAPSVIPGGGPSSQ
jgi:hypothetical protein